MRKLVATFLAALLLAFTAAAAQASVVFMYSAPDQTYGWCAGASYNSCEISADNHCRDVGGKDCRLAIECSGGAGAAAFSDDSATIKGFGASCHFGDSSSARWAALEACITASQDLCYTSTAFSPRAYETSQSANAAFDRIFYVQIYLYAVGYPEVGNADGVLGSQTRAAIRAFEAEIGAPATGAVTERTLELLSYAALGPQVAIISSTYRSTHNDETAPYTYGTAVQPAAPQTFADWLGGKTDEQQRTALAVIAATNKVKCTIPATRIEKLATGEAWNIDCAEGPYFVVVNDNTILVSTGHSTVDTPPDKSPDHIAPRPMQPTTPGSSNITAGAVHHGQGAGKPR